MTPVSNSRAPVCEFFKLSLCALLLCLSACGGEEAKLPSAGASSTNDPVTTASEPTARTFKIDSNRPQVAFTDRSRPPAAEVQVYLDERDPAQHGWMTEVVQARGREALQQFLEGVLSGPESANFQQLVLDQLREDFTTTKLRPADLKTVFAHGATEVLRVDVFDSTQLQAGEARKSLVALHQVFAGARDLRAEIEIVASVIDEPTTGDEMKFMNEALIVLSGVKEVQHVQVSTTWRVHWTERRDESPLLAGIMPLAYEEVRMPQPLFGDLTAFAMGSHPFFRNEFMLGVGDYYNKMDQLAGAAFIGSQGLAVGDADGDGRDDIYIAQQSGFPNRLFLHRPKGRALDVGPSSGVGFLDGVRSALFIDLDNDGDQDMALALGANVLIVTNDGRGIFAKPVLLESGGQNNVFSMCAADPDGDGDLDIYACHYILNGGRVSTLPTPYYDANNGSPNNYWRNEGNGKFTNATEEVGLNVNNTRFSLGAIWEDFDLDGDVDLYVTNDFGRNNLYRNDGGKFVDIAEEAGALDMAAGMGASVADYDRDGDMDVYISNMFMPEGNRIISHSDQFREGMDLEVHPFYQRISRGNTLLRNRGDGTFEDVTMEAGVWRGGWAWGATFGDFNNDGWQDIYVPNGFITGWSKDDVDSFHWRSVTSRGPLDGQTTESYTHSWAALEYLVMQKGESWSGHERNRVYLNTGDGRFADVGAASGADFLDDSRAIGLLDWDDDGRLDMIMKNRTAPRVRLLLNQDESGGDFLMIDLQGVTCNRDAIGARVELEITDATLRRTLHAGEGFIAQSSKRLHFGLGQGQTIRKLTVYWPDGKQDSYEGLALNERYRIVQGAPEPAQVAAHTIADLEGKTTPPLEAPPDLVVDRVVLVERIPLGPFRVPSFKNPARTVAAFQGAPTLFTVWASYGEACRVEFERLKRRQSELSSAGVNVIPLTIDEPNDFAQAQSLLAEAGLLDLAGVLDTKAQRPFEVVLSEVLGRSSTTPLPTSFLVDADGNLAVIYIGPVRVPQLLSDVAILKTSGASSLSGEYLLGAKWLTPRPRDLTRIVNALGMLGERELGKFLFDWGNSR